MGAQYSSNEQDITKEITNTFSKNTFLPLTIPDYPVQPSTNLELHFLDNNTPSKLYDKKEINKELTLSNQNLEINPNNELLWLTKAKLHMQLHKYKEAIKYIDVAIDKNNLFLQSYYMKIKCYYYLNDISNAIRVFDKLLTFDSNNYSILLNKALFYDDLKMNKEAIKVYDKLIEKDSTNPLGYYCKGNSLMGLNELNEAAHCFDKCIQSDNMNLNALLRKAVIYQQLNRIEDCKLIINHIEELIKKNVNDNNKKYDIEKINEYLKMLKLMDKLTEAENSYKEDIEINFKIYNGTISNFYEGSYKNKKIGVKIFKNKQFLCSQNFEILQKFCDIFSYKNAKNNNVIEIIALQFNRPQEEIRIGIEFCQGGNLSTYLFKNYKSIRIRERINMIKQISTGVSFLLAHDIKNFHITSRKILLTKAHNIKLSDIGYKAFFQENEINVNLLYQEIFNVFIEILSIPGANSNLYTNEGLINNIPKKLIDILQNMQENLSNNNINKTDLKNSLNIIHSIDII